MRFSLPLALTAAATSSSSMIAVVHGESHSAPTPTMMNMDALEVYKATITEIPGTNSGVTGVAYVFTTGDGTTIGYAGLVSGAQPGLLATTCNATNGCGSHIHSGFSCETTELQGGHYFVETPADDGAVAPQQTDAVVNPDPWVDERYSSDASGEATFASVLEIGTNDVAGRAFVFHNEDGSRAGCGLLTLVPEAELLQTVVTQLGTSGVAGYVMSHPIAQDSDTICFMAGAMGLEPGLLSYQANGTDCTATNGCGLHYHSGTSCENSTTQGGHFYNESVVGDDPWLTVGYLATTDTGYGYHAACVATGETDFDGRPFVFHANDGSRVACGVVELGASMKDDGDDGHDGHDHGDGEDGHDHGMDDEGGMDESGKDGGEQTPADEPGDGTTSASSMPSPMALVSLSLLSFAAMRL